MHKKSWSLNVVDKSVSIAIYQVCLFDMKLVLWNHWSSGDFVWLWAFTSMSSLRVSELFAARERSQHHADRVFRGRSGPGTTTSFSTSLPLFSSLVVFFLSGTHQSAISSCVTSEAQEFEQKSQIWVQFLPQFHSIDCQHLEWCESLRLFIVSTTLRVVTASEIATSVSPYRMLWLLDNMYTWTTDLCACTWLFLPVPHQGKVEIIIAVSQFGNYWCAPKG